MPRSVIIITDGVLTLADDAAGLSTENAWRCQVTSAAINASPNLQDIPATFCEPQGQAPAATSYELAVGWLQDWKDPGGGLSGYAFANDTLEKHFSLKLDEADTTTAVATGVVRLVAGAYGGDAGVPLVTTATWPVQGKPTIPAPPISAATAEATETEAQAEAQAEPVEDVEPADTAEPVGVR